MDRLHKALDRICDKKGLDTRDHLHRALDQVLTLRKAKLGGTPTDAAVTKAHTFIHGNKGEDVAPVGYANHVPNGEAVDEELTTVKVAARPGTYPDKEYKLPPPPPGTKPALKKGKDLIKYNSIVMDSEGRCTLEPVGK